MHVSAVLLAAGKGLRLGSKIPKPLVRINARPLIVYSLLALNKHSYIKDIIIVASLETLSPITKIVNKFKVKKVKAIVLGGALRQDSVLRGLAWLDINTDMVLIHDGARPFVQDCVISLVVNQASRSGAAICGVPVKGTIKKVKRQKAKGKRQFVVEKTIDRERLWEIQTPQVFRKELIIKAYQRFGDSKVTDDAMLVERVGARVSVVMGSYDNIKITTPEDLVIAEVISRKLSKASLAYSV